MPFIDVKDLRLYYEEHGEGDVLLLLHAAGSAIDDPEYSWSGLVGLFSQRFRTISLEHRGHGRTNNSEKRFDYATIADDVVQFAKALSIPQFHLAGISDGAIVGLHLGMHHPELLQSLVLLGVNYCNDERTQQANATWRHLPSKPDSSRTAGLMSALHDRAGKSIGSWRELFAGLAQNVAANPNYSEENLMQVATRTLLIAGAHDDYANSDQLSTLSRCLTNSELCVVDDAGHTAHYSTPISSVRPS